MPIPFVVRNYRTIRRFQQGILIEPADPSQRKGRRRDSALGGLAVGAGLISMLWASVWFGIAMMIAFVPKHILLAWKINQFAEPSLKAAVLATSASIIFVHAVFGTLAIRWGWRAIGRYQGIIKPSSIHHTISSGVHQLVIGVIAVFGAALWAAGLLYLLSTAYSRKGSAPDWVPSQYHSVWTSIYENGNGTNSDLPNTRCFYLGVCGVGANCSRYSNDPHFDGDNVGSVHRSRWIAERSRFANIRDNSPSS